MLIETMEQMCSTITAVQAEIEQLEDMIDQKKASIAEIKASVQEYFIESKREAPYVSPYGTLYLRTEMQVKQPKGPALKELFSHFEKLFGEEMAWQKMTINNQLLKSEIKQHIEAVELRGGDPILEPLPGVEAPTQFKSLQFRKKKA